MAEEEEEVLDSQIVCENIGFLDNSGDVHVRERSLHAAMYISSNQLIAEVRTNRVSKNNTLSQNNSIKLDSSITKNASILCQGNKNNAYLKNWGLPEDIIRKYEERGIVKMFEWQVTCLANPKVLMDCCNLVYSAPTSAGKTLVAEVLTIKTILERQKKVIIILPFVSIVREKMFYFQDIFSSSGIRVEGFMGSQSPPGGLLAVHVAICTIEKANSLVNRLLDEGNISELGAVIVDELHLLGDPHRGYILELLLTKIKYMSSRFDEVQIQVIGMSATLPNLEILAHWLEAELFITQFRPIPLDEFCLVGNKIFNKQGSIIYNIMSSLDMKATTDSDNILNICLKTIKEGCSVLIFCMTKNRCENLAQNMASSIFKLGCSGTEMGMVLRQQLKPGSIAEVLEQLKNCPVGLDPILKKAISFGVAYHHAGLTFDERDIIEGGFKSGAIRVLVATSTLSSGVNLPARKVIIRSPVFQKQPINILTYKQMIGRAGRMGKDVKGESILVCTEAEKKIGFDLMSGALDPVKSCIDCEDKFMRAILEMIASQVVCTEKELQLYSECTLLFSQKDNSFKRDSLLEKTLEQLKSFELIRVQGQGEEKKYVATALGKACLSSSMAPNDGLSLFVELQRARECLVLETDLHLIYLVTPYSVSSQWADLDWLHFWNLLSNLTNSMKRVGKLVGVDEGVIIRQMRNNFVPRNKDSNLDIHKRFYTALALQDLVNEVPLSEVALKFQCARGFLQGLQQAAATFAGMVTAFCRQLGWKNMEMLISQFQDRLHFGIHSELLELMKLPSLNGVRARTLFDAGFETVSSIASADANVIENALHKAVPFQSEKERDGDDSDDMKRRKKMKNIWITGCCAMTAKEAAENLIQEARKYLEHEIGVKEIKWDTANVNSLSQGDVSKTNIEPTKPAENTSTNLSKTRQCEISVKELAKQEKVTEEFFFTKTKTENQCNTEKCSHPIKCDLSSKVLIQEPEELHPLDSEKNVVGNSIQFLSRNNEEIMKESLINDSPLKEEIKEESLINESNVLDLSEKIFESDIEEVEIKDKIIAKEHDLADSLFTDLDTIKKPGVNQNTSSQEVEIKDEIVVEEHDLADSLFTDLDTIKKPVVNQNTSSQEVEIKDEIVVEEHDFADSLFTDLDTFKKPGINQNTSSPIISTVNRENSRMKNTMIENDKHGPKEQISKNPVNSASKSKDEIVWDSMNFTETAIGNITKAQNTEKTISFNLSTLNENFTLETERNKDKVQLADQNVNLEDTSLNTKQVSGNMSSKSVVRDVSLFSSEGDDSSLFEESLPVNLISSKLLDDKSTQIQTSKSYKQETASDLVNINSNTILNYSFESDVEIELVYEDELSSSSKANCQSATCFRTSEDIVLESQQIQTTIKDSHKSPFKRKVTDGDINSFGHTSTAKKSKTESSSSNEPVIAGEYFTLKCLEGPGLGSYFCKCMVLQGKQILNYFHTIEAAEEIAMCVDVKSKEIKFPKVIGNNIIKNNEGNTSDETTTPNDVHVIEGIALCTQLIGTAQPSCVYLDLSPFERISDHEDELLFAKIKSKLFSLLVHRKPKIKSKSFSLLVHRILNVFSLKMNHKILKDFFEGDWWKNCFDVSLAEWILGTTPANCISEKFLFFKYCMFNVDKHDVHRNFETIPKKYAQLNKIDIYCLKSAMILDIANNQRVQLSQRFPVYTKTMATECHVSKILAESELYGVPVDKEKAVALLNEFSAAQKILEKKAYKIAGQQFKLSSPQEVAKILGLLKHYGGGNVSTKKSVLVAHGSVLASIVMYWRKLEAVLTKTLYPVTRKACISDRITPSYWVYTSTGRISMHEPNLQNVPRPFTIPTELLSEKTEAEKGDVVVFNCREMIKATDGHVLVAADYCQLEMRILTHFCRDERLTRIMTSNGDVFKSIAASWMKVSEHEVDDDRRQKAKQLCYGFLYGMSNISLAVQMEVEESEAAEFVMSFYQTYPSIKIYTAEIVNMCRRNKYVETLMKRRRELPNIVYGENTITGRSKREAAERQAVNSTIQGSAADIAKAAMCAIDRQIAERPYTPHLILQMHDELIYEVPQQHKFDFMKTLKRAMEETVKLRVPLPVKLKSGRTWGSLRDVELPLNFYL